MVHSLMQQATAHVQAGITNDERLTCIRKVVAGGADSMRAQAIPEPLVVQRAVMRDALVTMPELQ